MSIFTVTVEMRPGRAYYILQFILFRQSVLDLLLYLFVLAITVWSQQVLLLNRSQLIRYLFLSLLFTFLFLSLSYRLITGYNFAYADAQTAQSNLHFWRAALQNYVLKIFIAFATSALWVFLLSLLSRKIRFSYSPAQAFVLAPILLISIWYVNRSLGVIDDLPAFYRVPVSTGLALAHELPVGERELVEASPTSRGVQHLFLIVDESITGSSLSLNGNIVRTTPYLETIKDSIINFGVASAITNNSAGSNIALMSGMQVKDLPDKERKALTSPSIFQYAKQAGYITYFVDAQLGRKALQNYMSPSDLNYVDHFIQPAELDPALPYFMRDYKVAELLVKLSKSEQKVFVYVNKVGAHWPYARTYPETATVFKPVLSTSSMIKDKNRSVNTYNNAIRWTVDGFWKELMQGITPADSTVIVYTSDHGQNLEGDGISITHASTNETKPIEANVPLWIMDRSNVLSGYTTPAPNQQSHEQVFPTLLLLQGYSPQFIKSTYGSTLFEEKGNRQRYFLTGDIFGRGKTTMLPFDYTIK
ncbi:sulfatase-like hydrolase/transferase [Pontibacter locisalis]|uniref:Sulfatase-like hydrolase/transferase n=2 Tax=Pontibacter locisalis TaxID=1719035 RepID=A0ABW5IRG3_9BACT